ncbi:MAG: hypothetical protein QNK37_23695 [Acidobacteriota bacterium]|nr:hypothetical protein [Acidobacteriota bacterium]
MITKVNVSRQDVEDTIAQALAEFRSQHNKEPSHLVLGRIAYEEFRNMQKLSGQEESPTSYKGLEIAVLEEPPNTLAIGSRPD